MLRFAFHGGARSFGEPRGGWVEPIDHPAIETFVHSSLEGMVVAVRERAGGATASAAAPARVLDPLSVAALRRSWPEWPLDTLWLEIVRDARGFRVICEAGARPTVPIFLCASGGSFWGDWDPLRLYGRARGAGLDLARTACFLHDFDQPYSRDTVFAGLKRLVAGAGAHWSSTDGVLEITYAEPPERIDYPRELRSDADPVATFETILGAELRRITGERPARLALQLSGGVDSAVVAGTAARHAQTAWSYGALLLGPDVEDQRARRAEFVSRFGLRDACIDGYASPPFDPHGKRIAQRLFVPWEEIYYEIFDTLLARASADGHRAMLTGLGGDETLALYIDELSAERLASLTAPTADPAPPFLRRPVVEEARAHQHDVDRAPRAYAQKSVLSAVSGAAAQSLRHGLWPVHPFASPELLRYCHALPIRWRDERRLARDLLARWGVALPVARAAGSETFSHVVESAMRSSSRTVFERFLAAERLADLGLVEPRSLRASFDAWCAGTAPDAWSLNLLAAAMLEASCWAMDEAVSDPPAGGSAPAAAIAFEPARR